MTHLTFITKILYFFHRVILSFQPNVKRLGKLQRLYLTSFGALPKDHLAMIKYSKRYVARNFRHRNTHRLVSPPPSRTSIATEVDLL